MDKLEQARHLLVIDPSELHFYSVGFVLEDKLWDTDIIEVYPIEKLEDRGPNIRKDDDETETINIVNKDGKDTVRPETITVKVSSKIRAKWLSLGQYNRITPPDVRKGEQVLLFRYANADMFFWTTINNYPKLRTREHVIIAYSDKKEMDINDVLDNMYFIEISTRDKLLHLHTSTNDGEYTTYDFKLNTKEGYFQILDGKNNEIKLDSTIDSLFIHMEGQATTYDLKILGDDGITTLIDGRGNEITLDSNSDTLTIKTNSTVNVQTENINEDSTNHSIQTTNYTANSSNHSITTSNYSVNAANSNMESSGSFSITSSGYSVKSNNVELIETLIELVNYIIQEQHVGNLGIDTNLTDASVNNYQQIIEKLNTIKG